jgi:hypothetical protein
VQLLLHWYKRKACISLPSCLLLSFGFCKVGRGKKWQEGGFGGSAFSVVEREWGCIEVSSAR